MLERLAKLERISRRLDPGSAQRAEWLEPVRNYAEDFLDRLPEMHPFVKDDGRDGFANNGISESGVPIEELLAFYRHEVDTTGILPPSGGQMGYIPGGGLYPSALGDFLAAISNRYSGVTFAGPGTSRMEKSLLDWMCRLVGYPDTAAGDLTSGGSLATLSAFVTARDAHGLRASDTGNACVYLTAQAHHCATKALHVAGLGEVHKREVPMDQAFRMDSAALARMVAEDRNGGLIPWLVVATAGTTDTGAVDPLAEIADICAGQGLWMHVDAAYGGFFLLCEEGRERLAGMGRGDSIVMDPHKGLGIPFGSGAVLVRNGSLLAASNSFYADYMQDARQPVVDADTPYSASDYSLELSRHARGPRMWLPLKLFGLEPFRASLAEKIWLARYFYSELEKTDGFETGPYPDLSIVAFRYVPQSGDADAFNRKLLETIHADGRVFLTSTRINGKFALRLAVLNFRTHRDRIDLLLEILRDAVSR